MRQGVGAASLVLLLIGEVGAGELILANGSQLDGELTNEMLVVSTGSDLIELAPEQVSVITSGELRLRDGRIVRGTLVGGHLTVRTSLGEIAVKPDELRAYRAHGEAAVAHDPEPRPPDAALAPATRTPAVAVAAIPPASTSTVYGRALGRGVQLEVIADDAPLRRDAIAAADPVGRVSRGQRVTYVDTVDRRLRMFNVLLFDGGHWVRVRAVDGTEGWLPAWAVRESR